MKVLLDDSLIDLSLVTMITNPTEISHMYYFEISFVGKKTITIGRTFLYSFKEAVEIRNKFDSDEYRNMADAMFELPEELEKYEQAKSAVNEMHRRLLERWNPEGVQYEDLTVK